MLQQWWWMLIKTTFRKKLIRRRPGLLPRLADKHHSSSVRPSEGHGAPLACRSAATFAFLASIKKDNNACRPWQTIPLACLPYKEADIVLVISHCGPKHPDLLFLRRYGHVDVVQLWRRRSWSSSVFWWGLSGKINLAAEMSFCVDWGL